MSQETPANTWRCKTCGALNRLENTTCSLCSNPRSSDAPGLGASSTPPPPQPTYGQPLSSPTTLTGEQPPASEPAPVAQQPPTYSPYSPPTVMTGPTGAIAADKMPAGLIVLVVLECLGILWALFSLLKSFAPQPVNVPGLATGLAVGRGMNLIGLIAAGITVLGFFLRWNAARIVAMIRYGLSVGIGLLCGIGGIFMLIGAAATKGTPMPAMGTTPGMPGYPPAGMPTTPGMPMGGSVSGIMGVMGGVVIGVGVFMTIVFAIALWYMTTQPVKDWLSE